MKIVTPLRAYLKYLVWLGLILLIMGFSAGLVSSWSLLAWGLLITGATLIALWLLLQESRLNSFWQRRSTQTSTNALVSILAVCVILGLINFLGTRYTTRFDLSEQQFFTLAPQSQQVLQDLKQPVKVWVFASPPEPAVRTLLEQYQRQGKPLFSFEFVDPQAQPGLAQKYGVENPGDIFLESGKRIQRLEAGVTESNLTPAIERITSGRQSKLYFLQGHGERAITATPGTTTGSLSQAIQALNQNNFTPEPLNLIERRQTPQDAAVIVVAAPEQALFKAEVQLLRDYLKRGGGVLLMVEPKTEPGLDALLQDWGIQLDNRLVVDASGAGQLVGLGPAVPLVNQYGEHPITKAFNGRASFYPVARAIQSKPVPNQQTTNLLITGEQSWAEGEPENPQLQFNPARDRKGPLSLGQAFSRAATPAQKSRESRLVVIGDADFAADSSFAQQLNGDVFLNSVTWLSNREAQTLSIRPKEVTNRRITLTSQSNRFITLLAIGFLPIAAFSTAAVSWWRRR